MGFKTEPAGMITASTDSFTHEDVYHTVLFTAEITLPPSISSLSLQLCATWPPKHASALYSPDWHMPLFRSCNT